jgi:hypothetical protein
MTSEFIVLDAKDINFDTIIRSRIKLAASSALSES